MLHEQALGHLQRGEVSDGELLLMRSLRSVPQGDSTDLDRSIRIQLSAWLHKLDRLKELRNDSAGNLPFVSDDSHTDLLARDTVLKSKLDRILEGDDLAAFLKQIGPIYAAALDAREQILLVSRRLESAVLRNTSGGRPIGSPFPQEIMDSRTFMFSPDGRTILAINGTTARLWEVAGRRQIGGSLNHSNAVAWALFRPDGGALLTICKDGSAWLWDASKGVVIKQCVDQTKSSIQDAIFCPNGRVLLTYHTQDSAEFVRLWDAYSGALIRQTPLEHHGYSSLQSHLLASEIAFSKNGGYLLTRAKDESARLWKLPTGEPVGDNFEHSGPYVDVTFSPDSKATKVLSGGADGTAQLWDSATWETIGTAFSHGQPVTHVRFSPDGKSILTVGGGYAKLWDMADRKLIALGNAHDAIFSSDGQLVLLRELVERPGRHEDERLEQKARILRVSTRDSVPIDLELEGDSVVWDLQGTKLLSYDSLAFPSLELDGFLWNAMTGNLTARLSPSPPNERGVIKYDSQGNFEYSDKIYGRTTDQVFGSLSFSPDGKLILASQNEIGSISWAWDSSTQSELPSGWDLPEERFISVAFSPDGKHAFTRSYSEVVEAWDLTSRQVVGEPLHHPFRVWSLAVSPDSRTILTGSADSITRLWDRSTGALRLQLPHYAPVSALAFSPDGKIIATATADKTVRLWNVANGNPLGGAFKHECDVSFVAFIDNTSLLTKSICGSARTWQLNTTPVPIKADRSAPSQYPSMHKRRSLVEGRDEAFNEVFWVVAGDGTRVAGPFGHASGHARLFDVGLAGYISDNGKTVLTMDGSGKMKVWDVEKNKESKSFKSPVKISGGAINPGAISPDGKTGATASTTTRFSCGTFSRENRMGVHSTSAVRS